MYARGWFPTDQLGAWVLFGVIFAAITAGVELYFRLSGGSTTTGWTGTERTVETSKKSPDGGLRTPSGLLLTELLFRSTV